MSISRVRKPGQQLDNARLGSPGADPLTTRRSNNCGAQSLHIILDKGQRAADPDAYQKSCLDALVYAGALVDDNRQHVELAPVTFSRDPKALGSVIRLEDL